MTYLITGANRGIGLEFVRQLAQRGHTIIATARDLNSASELQKIAQTHAPNIELYALDISSDVSIKSFSENMADKTIHTLINNAGIYPPSVAIGHLNYEVILEGFEVNAIGTLKVVEATLPALKRANGAKIVNISSKMGSIVENSSGRSYGYRMSKAALNMATKSLAIDLAPDNIIAFVMHPGWVQTRMGGDNALIDAYQSVSNMLGIIDNATVEDSGRFWEWNGHEIGW